MRINKAMNIYIPEQTQALNIASLDKAQIETREIKKDKLIIKDKPDYENFPERPLSETIEKHLNIIRNIEYVKLEWNSIYREHNGKIHEYKYSKELDLKFYNKLSSTYGGNDFIDIYI